MIDSEARELPVVIVKLRAATHRLIALQTHQPGARVPSLYMQLVDAVAGRRCTGNRVPRSMPTIWIDAEDLLMEIDKQTAVWQPRHSGAPPTVTRLYLLTRRSWRPEEHEILTHMVDTMDAWCRRITTLLEPEAVKTLSGPCPNCGVRSVKHHDSAGDLVNQPALRFSRHGCQCQACHTLWEPARYVFLAKLLACQPPAGVTAENPDGAPEPRITNM